MSQESGTESGQQEAAGRPTQRAAQKRTTTQRAAQSGQQEAAEGPTQETHRQKRERWEVGHITVKFLSLVLHCFITFGPLLGSPVT